MPTPIEEQAEKEKTKQELVESDKKKCQHIGYFVGYGFHVVETTSGLIGINAIVCMMCGVVFNPISKLGISTMPAAFGKSPFIKPQ